LKDKYSLVNVPWYAVENLDMDKLFEIYDDILCNKDSKREIVVKLISEKYPYYGEFLSNAIIKN
jgi:hypothetical protein